jgi:hypothetical protein
VTTAETEAQWLLVYLPFLQMQERVTIGPWQLSPSKGMRGVWPSPEVSRVARRFMRKHRTALGKPLPSMTFVTRDGTAALSRPPTAEEFTALQAAVTLGVLSANPTWSSDTELDSWRVSTSDNALLRATWITPDAEWFATERGSIVTTLSGGHRFNRRGDYIAAPLELHQPFSSSLDADVARSTYELLLGGDTEISAGLLTSITWLAQAWANSPSVGWNVRVVAIRSGIEVLAGAQGAWSQARALRRRFEKLTDLYPSASFDTIWSPTEEECLTVEIGSHTKQATPLEHWYVHLSRHRNATVHDAGSRTGQRYEVGTPYDGPFVWTGERVLRDLLRTELTLATGQPLVFNSIDRALRQSGVLDELRAALAADTSGG